MIKIRVEDWPIDRVLNTVNRLREQGIVQGTDFDFAYYPSTYDDFGGNISQRHTVFTFYTETMATWFSITFI